jgi:hypothetical protein
MVRPIMIIPLNSYIDLEADKQGSDVPKPKKRKMNVYSFSVLMSLQLRNTISTMVHGRSMIYH